VGAPVSAGLFGLLDDVAALARLAAASVDDVGAAAAKASLKAAGVVVDDAAVTPQYVRGLAAEREVPIIRKIARGSVRNKLVFILPVALLLSQLLPGALTPILMLGGAYLCFEGAEKVGHALGRGEHGHGEERTRSEDEVVSSAVRTDLILSAEIMVIALNEVADQGFLARLVILVIVGLLITVVVYGAVALIVKMDDLGLAMVERSGVQSRAGRFGAGLVTAMPTVLGVLSVVGTAAMLWVGGHIELVGLDELGLHAPYDLVHHLEQAVHRAVPGVGGVLAWLTNTVFSALLGTVLGAVVLAVVTAVRKVRAR
jgi:predicted DNA repair protein MutK